MKKLLFITFFSLPVICSAQKLLKPTIDKLTGDTTLSTSTEKVYVHGNYLTQQGEAVQALVTKSGKSISLILIPQTLNEKVVFTVTSGQKAYLKLKDNTTVTLTSGMNLISDTKVDNAGSTVYSSGLLRVPYKLTDADIAQLKTSELVFLRIETSTGTFDCDVKPKFSQVIKKELELITLGK